MPERFHNEDGFQDFDNSETRLMLMSYLYVLESADFLFLTNQTCLTHGNLSSHMTKLEGAGYIQVNKTFLNKRPHTMLELTKKGREAFEEYRERVQRVLNDFKYDAKE